MSHFHSLLSTLPRTKMPPNIAQPWRMLSHYVKTCMPVIVGISPKRGALFARKIQDEIDSDDVLRLQNLPRTRWTAGNVITSKHAELKKL